MSRSSQHNSAGFTLIEILVSMVIFVSVSGAIIGTYNYILRLNQRAQAVRLASDNARFIMEYLTREIRNGKILYTNRPSICGSAAYSGANAFLAITNIDGENECFYQGNNSGTSIVSAGTRLWVQKVSGGVSLSSTPVNGTDVNIRNVKFFVQPTTDPYASGSTRQESVTIVGIVESNLGAKDKVTIPFQTSVSLPLYDIPQP